MSEIKNRSELVFLYDIKDANPNGDPLDENKPRIDEETGTNLVTDVRLKRTIRDYLHDFKNEEIFVIGVRNDNGELKTKEDRLTDLEISSQDALLNKCVDIRLFGSTAAIKKKSIVFTGPVQFKIGRSLNKVKLNYIKGTTVMPSTSAKKQGTFTEVYTLPYSIICFYGIINENAAKKTKLTEADVKLLLDGMWNGTKNLISRSKAGQVPRLLMKVNYTEENYHVGDLNSMLKLSADVPEDEIRDISQFKIDVTELINTLSGNKDKIQSVEYKVDGRLNLLCNGNKCTMAECFKESGINTNEIVL
ncbi:MAG: type I-B CRISPR-associated protein Cas7/Csh2 [ANME-2 cluster archaeon]|jgi:CRISPR-associated protein Csh2|nr:type I-B CRISPR-associated protein Cas7/Csh2 [ANME-2 cluster archaeon]